MGFFPDFGFEKAAVIWETVVFFPAFKPRRKKEFFYHAAVEIKFEIGTKKKKKKKKKK